MQVDGIAFEAPAGLEDGSSYVYRSEAPHEEISVELELPAGRATPAEEVIGELREEFEGFYADAFIVRAEGEGQLAGRPARVLRFGLGKGDEQIEGKIVVANLADGDWVKLSWMGELEPAAVDARVDPIVSSFSASSSAREGASTSVRPGHERRFAGPWVLEVPEGLSQPRVVSWSDEPARLKIELRVSPDGAPAPLLGQRLGGRRFELLDEQRDELPDEEGGGERLRARLRRTRGAPDELVQIELARRFELPGPGAGQGDPEERWVKISASAPASAEARLEALVDELLASVTPAEAQP